MAFSIEYVYQAIDKFSPVAKKVAKALDKASTATRKFAAKLGGVNGVVTKTKNKLKSLQRQAKVTFSKLRDIGGTLTAKVTLPLLAVGGFALKASADIETLQTSFESLTGSVDSAKEVVTDLINFTAKTPFQLEGVGKAAKQLLSFGVAQKDLLPTMKQLGDISAGANVPLTDIALIFGKAKSKGKLMTEEILQLSERGIPIIDLLAKRFGVTKDVIFEAASKSQISFEMMEDAFKTLTSEGGIFFDQMAKQSRTLNGIFSTFKDNVNLSLAAIGDTLAETLDIKSTMGTVISVIQKATSAFKSFATSNPILTKFLVIMTGVLAIIGPLAIAIALLGAVINIAFLPVTAIVIGIAALIAAGILLMENWDTVSDVIGGTIDQIITNFQNFLAAVFGIFGQAGAFIVAHNPFTLAQEALDDLIDKLLSIDLASLLPEDLAAFLGIESTANKPAAAVASRTVDEAVTRRRERSTVDINMNLRGQTSAVSRVRTRTRGPANFALGRNLE